MLEDYNAHKFMECVEDFTSMVRSVNDKVWIVYSAVLPRYESHIDQYNDKGQAYQCNMKQAEFNTELVEYADSRPFSSVVTHTGLSGVDQDKLWSDSVHLSHWGARNLSTEFKDGIERAMREMKGITLLATACISKTCLVLPLCVSCLFIIQYSYSGRRPI